MLAFGEADVLPGEGYSLQPVRQRKAKNASMLQNILAKSEIQFLSVRIFCGEAAGASLEFDDDAMYLIPLCMTPL